MLTRTVRIQLSVFSVVAVVTVVAVAIFYMQLPAALGIGKYRVSATFAASGGLYPNANVTYRGSTIGKVTEVSLTRNNDVRVSMQLDTGIDVPENVTAAAKSVSAIGEQYVDLVPPADAATVSLRNGSHIDRANTSVSGDIAGLLRQAQSLVDSVNQTRLRDLLRETFAAFDGSGPELARLIESVRLLVAEAHAHSDDIVGLIDQVQPLLDAQVRSGEDVGTIIDSVARLTGQVRTADPQLRSVLQTAPGAAAEIDNTFAGIRPSFPTLAANLANFGRIGVIYHKSIEQVLVIMPAVTAAVLTIARQVPQDEGAKADFKLNLGDPPPCTTGFIPPDQIRSPADETLRELPPNLYCKVAQNDPTVVRGARNYPCQEYPGKRAPTVDLCRNPAGYVPLGSNPWRGPPVPYDTPVTDPRNILPPNKYPSIPPEADYDPGAPVVELPPGVAPGPGPAHTPPYPQQPPPATLGPPPPPLPFQAPPDQQLPPYGVRPDGSAAVPASATNHTGPALATYNAETGEYAQPGGGIGVFATGRTTTSSAETWVDLMRGPVRPT